MGFRDEPLSRMMNGEIVDMESLKTGVSITDLGLNEYALALKKYMEEHPGLSSVPPGINAVIEAKPDEGLVPGVVFFLRNRDEKLRNEANYFHPFYAIYLAPDGRARSPSAPQDWSVYKDSTQGKQIVELLRKGCEGKSEPIAALCKAFNKETKDGFKMDAYSALLSKAIDAISEQKAEGDVESLFNSTETTALQGDCSHIDSFELVAFFVVKEAVA